MARMVTTVDDNSNGFRLDLIPMALSSSDAASRSLLEATLALSSFHLGRPEEALQHKTSAIQSLSESFQGRNASRLAQLAACMMLCVYSVSRSMTCGLFTADLPPGFRRLRYNLASPLERCEDDHRIINREGTSNGVL